VDFPEELAKEIGEEAVVQQEDSTKE